jgi:hypothetical protein
MEIWVPTGWRRTRCRSVRTAYLYCPGCLERKPGELLVLQDYSYLLGLIPVVALGPSKTMLKCNGCANTFDESMDWPFDFSDSRDAKVGVSALRRMEPELTLYLQKMRRPGIGQNPQAVPLIQPLTHGPSPRRGEGRKTRQTTRQQGKGGKERGRSGFWTLSDCEKTCKINHGCPLFRSVREARRTRRRPRCWFLVSSRLSARPPLLSWSDRQEG